MEQPVWWCGTPRLMVRKAPSNVKRTAWCGTRYLLVWNKLLMVLNNTRTIWNKTPEDVERNAWWCGTRRRIKRLMVWNKTPYATTKNEDIERNAWYGTPRPTVWNKTLDNVERTMMFWWCGTVVQAFLLHGKESTDLRWLPKPVALATTMLLKLGEFCCRLYSKLSYRLSSYGRMSSYNIIPGHHSRLPSWTTILT